MSKYLKIRFFLVVAAVVVMVDSCKTVEPSTMYPKMKNEMLLPSLTPVFDIESFEPYARTISGEQVAYNDGGSATRNNLTLYEYDIIFKRDVSENICNASDNAKGTIKCSFKHGNVSVSGTAFWFTVSLITLGSLNLLGMPFAVLTDELQIEVTIIDNNNQVIERYTSDLQNNKSYCALYWGYNDPSGRNRRLIFTACMDDIKRQIARDYDRLNVALQ